MKYHALSGLLCIALLAGCSSKDAVVPDIPPSQLYSEAQTALESGRWVTAIDKLEAMDSRYPFGAYSHQVQLDLMYAYYKNSDYSLAIATIDRFARLNPTNEKMDWVLYMRGLTNMAKDNNMLHELFDVDRSDRDPLPAQDAFNDFNTLLKRYPNSVYALDAKQRAVSLRNRLADYQLAAADYYLRRKAWIAAVNRCQELQQSFPETEAARKSLLIQRKAYQALKLSEPLKHTEALIALNPV